MLQLMSVDEMRATARAWRREGQVIGLVPTMGFLHAGHVSLMRALRPRCDRLVVSIFVNPLQFGPTEDLDRYPRDPEGDAAKCREAGVDAIFSPAEMYPPDFRTTVRVDGLTSGLCGAARPTHFAGVTTVVARLFGVTGADVAIFGEKDYQQLAVIRRMARDLALPVEIVPGELIRDADGLALSSRNVYLSPDERARGLSLHRALFAMRDLAAAGEADAEVILAAGASRLEVDRLDYLALVDADTLEPVADVLRPCRALVAGFVGKTRLIDNVAVGAAR
jgi:pantoate--beta-alanine ligase